jgi:hypothetical protein
MVPLISRWLSEKDDNLYLGTLLLALTLLVATWGLSDYAIKTIFMFFFDYPIGVAFQLLYSDVVIALVAFVHFLMKRPSPRRVVIAGTILGLTSAVFIHDSLNIFLPFLWFGEIPASILAMLVTACAVPLAVTLLELRRQSLFLKSP